MLPTISADKPSYDTPQKPIPSPNDMESVMKIPDSYWIQEIRDSIEDGITNWEKMETKLFPHNLYKFHEPFTHHMDYRDAWSNFVADIKQLFNQLMNKQFDENQDTHSIRKRIINSTNTINLQVGYSTPSASSKRNSASVNLHVASQLTPQPYTPHPNTPDPNTPKLSASRPNCNTNPKEKSAKWNLNFDTSITTVTTTPLPTSLPPLQSTTSSCEALSDTEAQATPDEKDDEKSHIYTPLKRDDSKENRQQMAYDDNECCYWSQTHVYLPSYFTGIYGVYNIRYKRIKPIKHKENEDEYCTDRFTDCKCFKRLMHGLKVCNGNEENVQQLFDDFCHFKMKHIDIHYDTEDYCRNVYNYYQREMAQVEEKKTSQDILCCDDIFKAECSKIRWYFLQLNPDEEVLQRRSRSSARSNGLEPCLTMMNMAMIEPVKVSKQISIEITPPAQESPLAKAKKYLYVGAKEDNEWWKGVRRRTKMSQKEDKLSDDDIHRTLVHNMGVFRWQNPHGFMAAKDAQEAAHYRPKHDNIKEEVLNNTYSRLSPDSWNQTLRKTNIFYNSFARQRLKTLQDGFYEDQITQQRETWTKNTVIIKKEIIVLKLYTDFDELQGALKQCFRFETYKDILRFSDDALYNKAKYELAERLKQFWHWRASLLVTLNKFGRKMSEHNKKLYHGVNAKMIIKASQTFAFSGPLSTTSSFHVARTFATGKGMVLTIGTQYPRLNYCNAFDVSLISEYPEEQEWLVGFMYARLYEVSTRGSKLKINDILSYDQLVNKVPLSSWVKELFFVIHLFDEQIFSLGADLEKVLNTFLSVKQKECCNKYEIKQGNYLCSTLCDIAHHKNEMKVNDEDEWRMKRITKMLWTKFVEVTEKPNYKQHLRFDSMSDGLRAFFMDETEEKDIHTKEKKWRISFEKITNVYPNIKDIYFLNEYKFNDRTLKDLIQQIKRNKENHIKKISFLYYNYDKKYTSKPPLDHKSFYDPDKLNEQLKHDINKLGWNIKHGQNGITGYKVRIYKRLQ